MRNLTALQEIPYLARRHRFSDQPLQRQLLLLQVIAVAVLDLELRHGVREGSLDLLLGAALELERHGGVRGDFFDAGDVGFELLAGFEFLGESVVGVFEFGGVCEGERGLVRGL